MNPPDQPMTVSVIIPAYRSAATLPETLDSIEAQTQPVNEIIVIDDASPDNTTDVVTVWRQQHQTPVTLIRLEQNGGPATARNRGIEAATSEWIAFLDADDAWLPSTSTIQQKAIQQHPEVSFVCGQTIDLQTTLPSEIDTESEQAEQLLQLEDFVAHNPVATSTVLINRQRLLDAEGFDPQFCGPEDYDLWLRLVAQQPALLLPVPLCRYRCTVGSLSMDDRKFLPQVLGVLRKAFGPGGALVDHQSWRRHAFAEQYTAASWMAYHRGARLKPIALLLRSWLCGPVKLAKEEHDATHRLKLLLRYCRPAIRP